MAQSNTPTSVKSSRSPREKDSEQPVPVHHPESDSSSEDLAPASPWKAYFSLLSPKYVPWLFTLARIAGCFGSIGAGVCFPLMAVIFGDFVNDFNGWALGTVEADDFKEAVGNNSLILVYLFVARFACDYIGVLCFHIAAAQTCRELRMRYMHSVMAQKIEYFDKHSTASVSTRLAGDVNLVEVGLGEKISVIIQGIAMLVSAFVVGFIKQWKLTLVCASVIPWGIVVVSVLSSLDAKIVGKMKALFGSATAIADEALASPQNVLALGATDKILEKFMVHVNKALDYGSWRGAVMSSIYGNMFFSMHCCYALALHMGVKLVHAGEIRDGGTVMTVMFCAILASNSLGMIAPNIPDCVKAAATAKSVLALLPQESDPGSTSSTVESEEKGVENGNISLTNLHFSYPTRPDVSVLSGLSLEALAGKMTAIVGPSGSGKSTIIALLERWYEVSGGSIALGGRDISTYGISAWRSMIGLVQQDPVLFDDTVFQNVLNGYNGGDISGLSHEEQEKHVTEACIQANAHDFIVDLPEGYQTKVGERATFLSGGQKQRIAIARAIISNPQILLLDEATSALDSESERLVQEALDKASVGRTTITIVHHLATIRKAAKIIIMDKGKVVEEGTHDELSARGGMYCQLLRTQNTESAETSSGEQSKAHNPLLRVQTSHTDIESGGEQYVAIDDPSISRKHGNIWTMWRLLRLYPNMVPAFSIALAIGLVASAAFPVTAYLFSKLVTVFQLVGQSNFVSRGNFWALMFFFLALSELFSYGVTFYFLGQSNMRGAKRFRPAYLRSMLTQDSSFFQVPGHSSGALVTLLFTDPESLEGLTAQSFGLVHIYIWDVVACCILSLVIYWKLALVAIFGCFPVIFFAGSTKLKLDMRAAERCERSFLESARFGSEAITNIKTVSSLRLEKTVLKRYSDKLDNAVDRNNFQSVTYFLLYAFCDSVDLAVLALMFWYGGNLLADLELSVDDYFIIYTAILFGGQAAAFAIGFTSSLSKSQAAGNRILYLTSTTPTINSTKGVSPSETRSGEAAVRFEKVHFRYPSRAEVSVLRGVSFTAKPGESICLVGRSGCGKSTILSLVERFYDATKGAIVISGTDIKELDISQHRARMAFVGQETMLYQGTIRENLLLGVADPGDVPQEDIERVCREASIHDFVSSLPQGYDTDIGPRGSSLSGGQRQRLAIARALLREPEILLLDEATSALDAENERMVGEAIAKAERGRTVLAATHHVEAMKRADRVLVMDKGMVVEEGSFEELSKREGGWLWRLRGEGEMS